MGVIDSGVRDVQISSDTQSLQGILRLLCAWVFRLHPLSQQPSVLASLNLGNGLVLFSACFFF